MRRHRISDWNVYYGMFGKTDYAKRMGEFVLIRSLIDLFIFIPLRIFWIVFLFLLNLTGIAIQSAFEDRQRIRIEQEQTERKSLALAQQISDLVADIATSESKVRRRNNAKKVLSLLDELKSIGRQDIFYDFDTLKQQAEIIIKAVDALDNLDKADKQYFLKDKKKELKYLLEAIYHLKINRVTKREFNSLKAKSEITQLFWTVDYLKKRILGAGYKPSPT